MIRVAVLAAALSLAACQVTIDPVIDDYYGLRATVTVSPNVIADPFHDVSDPSTDEEVDP